MAQSAKLLARYPTREKEPIVSNRNKLPWLSFDCYDTLVRYSESKASALENIVRSNGRNNDAVAMAQNEFETQERRIQAKIEKQHPKKKKDKNQSAKKAKQNKE